MYIGFLTKDPSEIPGFALLASGAALIRLMGAEQEGWVYEILPNRGFLVNPQIREFSF